MKNLTKGRIALFLCALMWGTSFVFMHTSLENNEPFNILSIRFILAALTIYCFSFNKINKLFRENLKKGIIIGMTVFLAYSFQTYGLMLSTPAKNAFLTATSVVFVPLILYFVFRNKIDIYTKIGCIMVVIGIGCISSANGLTLEFGDILSIIGGFFFACVIILASRYLNENNLHVIVFLQLLVVGICALIFSLLFENFTLNMEPKLMGDIIYLAIVATAATYFLQNYGIRYVASSESAIIISTEALFGTIFSIMVGKEALTTQSFIGFIIIFIAIIIVETKLNFLKKTKKSYSE